MQALSQVDKVCSFLKGKMFEKIYQSKFVYHKYMFKLPHLKTKMQTVTGLF